MGSSQVVYVIERDTTISSALGMLLGTYDIPVEGFNSAAALLDVLADRDTDCYCLLVDQSLPDLDGISLIRALRDRDVLVPVLLLADGPDQTLREQADALGVADVIERRHMASYLFDRLAQMLPEERWAMGMASLPLPTGAEVRFRTMRPEDAGIEQDFVRSLSRESRYLRFFSGMSELPPKLLQDMTNPEYPDSYAVIATVTENGVERQIGVARYSPTRERGSVEFAVVVADEWQGYGIARHLLTTVTAAAVLAGMTHLEGHVLRENARMLGLARKLGFRPVPGSGDLAVVRIGKDLTARRTM